MRVVVTGKRGQVSMALAERATEKGVRLVQVGRPEFDLLAAEAGLEAIAAAKPDAIVSAAAYTAVDKAEIDYETARTVNVDGPRALAQLAADLAVPLIHLSTDYVFDGAKPSPYLESDRTNPLSVYGNTKLAGEIAVAAGTQNHAVLRTAWVYSPFGVNFLKTMLRLCVERSELRVVDDQIGNPTSAFDIADAILKVAGNLISRPAEPSLRGTFHMTGTGEASWADFAGEIIAAWAHLGGQRPKIVRIRTADFPTAARRPANSRLSSHKLGELHGIILPDWRSSTQTIVRRLSGESPFCSVKPELGGH
ncbi:MAG TPA: dTDP-4-dehydrorhamnose reductase [Ramlibacter sp.]|jgi:dTDP-4-dehydrorhamnose reductase